jgi:hypothetical protein
MNTLPDDDRWLDQALDAPLLEVPDGFTDRVMAALPEPFAPPAPTPAAVARRRAARWLKALALAAGSAAGLAQALSFAWGLWTATAVGLG